MYIKKSIFAGMTLEVEKTYTIKYKSKKVTRSANINLTPENMKKVNERNAAKKIRRQRQRYRNSPTLGSAARRLHRGRR